MHFTALNLFISKKKKGLKKVIRHLSTLRTWMLTLSFNILTCVYLCIKAMKKLNDNLIKEEDFSPCYYSTQLKRRKSTGRKQPIFDKYDNKHCCKYLHLIFLTSFFAICNVFFFKDQRKKDGSNFEPFTMSSFPKTPASCALASEYLQCY